MGRMMAGLAGGAIGTEALNIVTYLDVAVRGRAQSETPAQAVEAIAGKAGIGALTKQDDTTANRRGGMGALLGYATGLSVGLGYGVVRPLIGWVPLPLRALAVGAAAMAASDIPMTMLEVTDPKEWPASSWAADIVPHLAYGAATVMAYEGFKR